ncbi:hypothetical protein [[Pseudomonas] boreopolis]|uniref:Uncharacterized protein n=1 Tax=Xanthomonas boreopolis TaxID=86183 RepID=A0A919F7C9_9XANT|nr:hypothetical protein GCM10009090_16230 [[Pseudomonas] boreopolis]
MSAPVNALAVLRAARDSVPAEQLLAYCAAIANVVELIEAAEFMLAPAYRGPDQDTLRAALARVRGGAQ